jgi:tetratricopeptide (TPR) repeat protein
MRSFPLAIGLLLPHNDGRTFLAPLAEPAYVNQYQRADVLRILRISNRQMQGWERAGLLPVAEAYTFFDLLQIKNLRDLRAKRVRPAVILRSLEEMRLASGMANPLLEASVFSSNGRVAYRHHGKAMEPIAGQFVMDFAEPAVAIVMSAGKPTGKQTNVQPMRDAETAADMFARGVALEENPATQAEAIQRYQKVLQLEPAHAAAHINLGTIYYNRHDFPKAEMFYRQAIEADSRYALAYFDLGNVLDETGRLPEAVNSYKTAILLAPTYADAHYNLALAYEKLLQPRRALRHWRAYAKLDTVGPWATHARTQMRKILDAEPLRIVSRRGQFC